MPIVKRQNMKKFILTALLTTGLASTAFAQLSSGDIVLGFRDTGNAGAGNLAIKLGLGSALVSNATGNGGTYLVTNLLDSGTYGSSTISGIFGAGWATSSTLKWAAAGSVLGTDDSNPEGARNTLFATKSANSSSLDGTAVTAGWNTGTSTVQNAATALISPVYSNFGSGNFRTSTTTATGAWSKQEVPVSGTNYFGYFASGPTVLENSTNITGTYVSSDLWKMSPTNNGGDGSKTFLGTLAIYGNGDVKFSSAFTAIPEPSTYAAILGVVALGVAAYRRQRQVTLA